LATIFSCTNIVVIKDAIIDGFIITFHIID